MKTSVSELRKYQYEYHFNRFPYMRDWKTNPYTCFKARVYMELSAILVYLLLKTSIHPNTVTICYIILGIIGGVLLAIPVKTAILFSLLIFFLKGVLDWSDGHLARIKGQTSVTGGILDPYASLVGHLAFQMGLGFYVAQKSGIDGFYYLAALIPFFSAANLQIYAFYMLFIGQHITTENIRENIKNDLTKKNIEKESNQYRANCKKGIKYRLVKILRSVLDERARTVDLVCLIVLLELFFSFFITWIIFLGFVFRQLLLFSASFYIVARGGWAEEKLESKLKEISRSIQENTEG